MDAECANAMSERLCRVERELLFWIRGVLCGASLMVLLFVSAANQNAKVPEVLTARRAFVLVDERGQTKASLGTTEDGSTSLALFGKDGEAKPRILLGMDPTESFASLSIYDRHFKTSVMLGNHTSREAGSGNRALRA